MSDAGARSPNPVTRAEAAALFECLKRDIAVAVSASDNEQATLEADAPLVAIGDSTSAFGCVRQELAPKHSPNAPFEIKLSDVESAIEKTCELRSFCFFKKKKKSFLFLFYFVGLRNFSFYLLF